MSSLSQLTHLIKQRLLVATFFAFALGSCQSDHLDLAPINAISDISAYSTPDKIQSQVRSLYARLASESLYGGRYIIFNEQRGNEFGQNDGNNSTGANVWNQSISGSGDFVNAVWNVAYSTINFSNILLDNLATTTVIDEATKTKYIAEAKYVRALAYFSLIQTYARPYAQNPAAVGIPLRLKGETSGGNNDLAFAKISEVYDQIINDLDEAEKGLPDSYADALTSISRARKVAAIALKSRVYLVKGDYAKVIAEASKLVSSSAPAGTTTVGLENDVTTVFSGSYTGKEAIFSIPFSLPSESPGLQSSLAGNYLSPVLYLSPSGIIADEVFQAGSTDKRKNLIKTNAAGQLLLNKFQKNGAPFTDYVPVIRYAEVLLNYAEAAAQTGDTALALTLLSTVRQRSDVSYSFTTTSQEDLVNKILNERRIELLGEGFRTHDLFRNLQPLPAKIANAGTAPEVKPTDENYVWAIPSNELAYNKLSPR